MINGKDNPVEWAMMAYELEDAIEHLKEISNLFEPEGEVDEVEFSVYLGHVYAHLNRIWNSRNHVGEVDQTLHDKFNLFPADIEPCG